MKVWSIYVGDFKNDIEHTYADCGDLCACRFLILIKGKREFLTVKQVCHYFESNASFCL